MFFIGYLYKIVYNVQDNVFGSIQKVLVSKSSEFANSVEGKIRKHVKKDLYVTLKNSPELREKLEDIFSVLVTPSFKYVYVLYRDKNGRYRYLLDGSNEDEKGEFDQKLDVDKKSWDEVYITKSPKIILQNGIENLSVTYLKPFICKQEVEAVIAIDFSTKLSLYIAEISKPIKKVFHYIFYTILILIIILILSVYTTF